MKGISVWRNGNLCFKHFVVEKRSETFYGVYACLPFASEGYGDVITSGTTFHEAARKAKLLDIGYRLAVEDAKSDPWWEDE